MYVWYCLVFFFLFFFFFQAEDGIRDYKVTGVQTCALPISAWPSSDGCGRLRTRRASPLRHRRGRSGGLHGCRSVRSEERRVGKECRSRGGAEQSKEKRRRDTNSETSTGIGETRRECGDRSW